MELKLIELDWEGPFKPCEDCRYDHIKANSPLGKVTVEWKGWKEYDSRDLFIDGYHISSHDDIEEAKVAAREHLESFVRKLLILPEGTVIK